MLTRFDKVENLDHLHCKWFSEICRVLSSTLVSERELASEQYCMYV